MLISILNDSIITLAHNQHNLTEKCKTVLMQDEETSWSSYDIILTKDYRKLSHSSGIENYILVDSSGYCL